MKRLPRRGLLLLSILALQIPSGAAQLPPPGPAPQGNVGDENPVNQTVQSQIHQGDQYYRNGDRQTALFYYNEAHRLSSQSHEWYGMLSLAQRYLMLGLEDAAIQAFEQATTVADYWAVRDSSGLFRTYGQQGFQSAIDYYNEVLRTMPASQSTLDTLRQRAQWVADRVSGQGSEQPQPQPQPLPQPTDQSGGGDSNAAGTDSDAELSCRECVDKYCGSACDGGVWLLCVPSNVRDPDACESCLAKVWRNDQCRAP